MSSSFKRRSKINAPPSTSAAVSPHDSPHDHGIKAAPAQTKTLPRTTLLPGTKPWTNNQTLTSFGLREIDSFFFSSSVQGESGSGGQPLQSLVLVEEDRLADDLAVCLCRYWCGEGVAQGQIILMAALLSDAATRLNELSDLNSGTTSIVDHCNATEGSTPKELNEFTMKLPRNLHLDKFRARAKEKQVGDQQVDTARKPFEIIQEQDETDEELVDEASDQNQHNSSTINSDEGLVNAWQYRKSVQDERRGIGSTSRIRESNADQVYCHSFDLSRTMWEQYTCDDSNIPCSNETINNPLVTNVKIVDCYNYTSNSSISDHRIQGMTLFRCLWGHIQSALSDSPSNVIRLFLRRLPIGPGSVALPLLMAKIRQDSLPIILLATIRPWRWMSDPASSSSLHFNNNKRDMLASLRSTADTIFSLDSFSSFRSPPPPEFSLLQGILTVRKCASFTTSYYTDTVAANNRPLAERFGVKRDGRKVTVQLLHLPPEEYSRGGSSTDGVRSGGGNVGKVSGDAVGGCSSLGLTGGSLDF